MYNLLKWQNPNGALAVTVNIYRGDAALDRTALSNPIVSLTNGETQYKDATAVRGNTYFYVFETISANDRVVSPNYQMTVSPRRGPDPQVLTIGDYNYGYFGSVLSANFVTATQVATAAGVTALTGYTALQTSPRWHKYARNGKILMVPEGAIANGSGLNWNNLYGLGLVFGTDGNGPYNNGTPTPQNKTITIGADKFRIRMMTGYSDDYTQFAPTTTVADPVEGTSNDWDDLVAPLSSWCPAQQRMQNISNLANSALYISNTIMCQEKVTSSAGNIVNRGSTLTTRAAIAQRSALNAATAGGTWWPVLELIETTITS